MDASQGIFAGARWRTGLGKRVFAWLALASLIFAAVTAGLFASIAQLVSSAGWMAHSYQVIDALDRTEDVFTDAQSAERGYVATCKLALISPFRSDLPRLYSQISVLRGLTADNPAQQRRVASLHAALNDELTRMSAVVAENLGGDLKGAQTALSAPADIHATRTIFTIIDAMEAEERNLLATRLHNIQRNAVLAVTTCSIGVAGSLAILGFLFWLIRREVRRREDSELSLHQSNSRLVGSLAALKRYNETARSVAVLGELLQTCRNKDEAIAIAAQHIEQLLPGTSGTIAELQSSRDLVEVICTIGDASGFATRFAPDDCWALRRGRSHRYRPGSGEPCCAHLTCGGGMSVCLTLSAHNEMLGVLSLQTADPAGLDGAAEQAVQTIVEQLSLTLSNLRLQETLRNQSIRDPLTDLFNRRYMDEALAREIARAERHGHPMAVAMLDIDHFKRFNDAHGHDGGDALLAAFGRMLTENARAEDIVCRYGGEEFAVILPGAGLRVAKDRLETLRQKTKHLAVQLRGQTLGGVTLSAGIAMFPEHGPNGAVLLHVADTALYQAKQEGRDRVVAAPTAEALHALGRPAAAGRGSRTGTEGGT
ncbi:MAG: diguanylate cyclase [Rhizomicrobium sp.]